MKKLFFVFAVAGFVLSTINSSALADDDIISAIISGTMTYKEYHKAVSEPIIPPGSKREILRVDIEKVELKLYSGVYWIFDGEKKIRVSTEGLIFLPLTRGVYVLYTKPPAIR